MNEKLYLNFYFLTFMMKLMVKHRLRRFSLKEIIWRRLCNSCADLLHAQIVGVYTTNSRCCFVFVKFCAFSNDLVIFIVVYSQNQFHECYIFGTVSNKHKNQTMKCDRINGNCQCMCTQSLSPSLRSVSLSLFNSPTLCMFAPVKSNFVVVDWYSMNATHSLNEVKLFEMANRTFVTAESNTHRVATRYFSFHLIMT